MATQSEAIDNLTKEVRDMRTSVDVHIALTKTNNAQFRKELDEADTSIKSLEATKNKGLGYLLGFAAVGGTIGTGIKTILDKLSSGSIPG